MRDTVPDSPLFRIFLKHQKHVNQVLPSHRVEQFHKIWQVIDRVEL